MKQVFNIPSSLKDSVLPPVPFPIINRPQPVTRVDMGELTTVIEQEADKIEYTVFGSPQVVPVMMKLKSDNESDWWLLPVEPLITISGKNILAKRSVSKSTGRGTIKERWAQDDYVITIEGLITTPDSKEYPKSDMAALRRLCEAKKAIDVKSPAFEILGIDTIVIEDFTYPFTKGPENQNYSIKALSDDVLDLLIKIDSKG